MITSVIKSVMMILINILIIFAEAWVIGRRWYGTFGIGSEIGALSVNNL